MIRFSPWMFLLALLALGLWMPSCDARGVGGGGRGGRGGGNGGADTEVPPVEWSPNIPDAEESSKKVEKPYLLYFCTEEVAKFAGTGSEAIATYKKTNKLTVPFTPFENKNFMDTFNAYGYPVVKVIASPQTVAVAKKYKVLATPALIGCAPNGEVIAQLQGEQCSQTNMLNMVKNLKDTYDAWKKANEAKDTAKGKDAKEAKEKDATKPADGAATPPADPPAQAANNTP